MHGRYFELINFQHFMLYFFPALIFLLLFAAGLAYSHFRPRPGEKPEVKVVHTFVEGIEDRDEPFPLVVTLIIAGTVIWGFFYIWFHGQLGVRV
ncbi:MAG: hypothetical protein ACOWWM_03605 [Desulfobacterales bacterium]